MDISAEVEAFDIQFAFEEAMNIESISIFRKPFDVINSLGNASQQQFLKESVLWHTSYGNYPNYTSSRGWSKPNSLEPSKLENINREINYILNKRR